MQFNFIKWFSIVLLFCAQSVMAQQSLQLQNKNISLKWKQTAKGFQLSQVAAWSNGKFQPLQHPSGEFTLLYSEQTPDTASLINTLGKEVQVFPGSSYKYIIRTWRDNLRPVPMNTAGTALHFFPDQGKVTGKNTILFSKSTNAAIINSSWQLDDGNPNDILVIISITSLRPGYFSIATPTLAMVQESELKWGIIPGLFQGSSLQANLVESYGYGHGIPNKPIIVRERTASTLSPILTNKTALSLALIPAPGTARHLRVYNAMTFNVWTLGLS